METLPMDNANALQPIPETTTELAPEQRAKVNEIVKTIDIEDSQCIVQYGVGAQSQIAGFADNILREVRAKDSGYVGEIMSDLVLKVKDLDVDSLSANQSFMASIPIIGNMVDAFKRFLAKYQKLSTEIEKIVDELDKSRMQLLKDITMLDTLYEKNYEYLKELDCFIVAGALKLKEIQTTVIPEFKAKAEATKDPMDAQRYNDMTQLADRFEKKLHDLKLSRIISIQTAPQIRLIQNNDQVLVEKIQSSILNTIPIWKNQIVIAITLFRQKKALEVQREVTDTTNELLAKNSEMLKDSSIEIAKESERGIVEIETLKKVNADLIQTLEETIRIQQEGRVKRQQAETELQKIEMDLKDKLTAVRG